MSKFIKTNTILDTILAHKVQEVALAQKQCPLHDVRRIAEQMPIPPDFVSALAGDHVALIAEVKQASPSKGQLVLDFNPYQLAELYETNGASAISVLTDEKFFQGKLDYLAKINQQVSIPTLRKDFLLDPYQVYEACAAGAAAVLLIVAALDTHQLLDLYALTTELNLTALIEIHNEHELERAMRCEPALLGINNRNLKTFEVDLQTTQRIAGAVPDTVTLVAESGLQSQADIARMGAMGAHAVLIGEALVTAKDMPATVRAFSSQERG